MISYQRVVITKKICVIIPIYMQIKRSFIMVNYPNKKKNNHYTSMIEGKHNTAHLWNELRRRY